MYLSRVKLNAGKRDTMKAMAAAQQMHGAVERSFDGERQRNLWRIDWLGDACYLLILSPERPNLAGIARQFGYSDSEVIEIKDYDALLARIRLGQTWQFRLRANRLHSSRGNG
jgi:CRISPR system Cascade subunit CasE